MKPNRRSGIGSEDILPGAFGLPHVFVVSLLPIASSQPGRSLMAFSDSDYGVLPREEEAHADVHELNEFIAWVGHTSTLV